MITAEKDERYTNREIKVEKIISAKNFPPRQYRIEYLRLALTVESKPMEQLAQEQLAQEQLKQEQHEQEQLEQPQKDRVTILEEEKLAAIQDELKDDPK